jgi:hypothetical protein
MRIAKQELKWKPMWCFECRSETHKVIVTNLGHQLCLTCVRTALRLLENSA